MDIFALCPIRCKGPLLHLLRKHRQILQKTPWEGNLTKNWSVFAANTSCCLHLHSHLAPLQLGKKWHRLASFCIASVIYDGTVRLYLRKNVGHEHHQQRNCQRHGRVGNQQHVVGPHDKEYKVTVQRNKGASRACKLCCESLPSSCLHRCKE